MTKASVNKNVIEKKFVLIAKKLVAVLNSEQKIELVTSKTFLTFEKIFQRSTIIIHDTPKSDQLDFYFFYNLPCIRV